MPTKGKLTIQEKLAAQYMALGMSLTEAAAGADISLPVLRRAMQHPLFEGEVERCRARAFPSLAERLGGRLQAMQEPALESLNTLMLNAESEAVRLKATEGTLDRGGILVRHLGSGHGGGQGQAPITLDHAALHAILSGALNMGQQGIIMAFASLGTSMRQGTSLGHAPAEAEGHAIDVTPAPAHGET